VKKIEIFVVADTLAHECGTRVGNDPKGLVATGFACAERAFARGRNFYQCDRAVVSTEPGLKKPGFHNRRQTSRRGFGRA
jgi:hypothetical protein